MPISFRKCVTVSSSPSPLVPGMHFPAMVHTVSCSSHIIPVGPRQNGILPHRRVRGFHSSSPPLDHAVLLKNALHDVTSQEVFNPAIFFGEHCWVPRPAEAEAGVIAIAGPGVTLFITPECGCVSVVVHS